MTATLIPSPGRRLLGRARHAAATYLETIDRCPAAAGPYYRRVEASLCAGMATAGIERVDVEAEEFRRLVMDEIQRQVAAPAEDAGARA